MDWKIILNENLKILGYSNLGLEKSEPIEYFETKNTKALQHIVMFILSLENRMKFDELSKLALLESDKKSYITFLRSLYTWSMELILKTFPEFKSSTSFFQSPQGSKAYEFLSKLSSSFIKCKTEFEIGSDILRPSVSTGQIKDIGLSSLLLLKSLENDFIKETKIYLTYLDTLIDRKEHMEKELKNLSNDIMVKKNHIINLWSKIALKKIEIQDQDYMNNSISQLSEALIQKWEKNEGNMKLLMEKIRLFAYLCDDSCQKYLNKSTLDLINIKLNKNCKLSEDLLTSDNKLSLSKVLKHIATELAEHRQKMKGIVPMVEIKRALDGIEHISSVIKSQVAKCADACQTLLSIDSEIETTAAKNYQFPNLSEFGPLPTVEMLMDMCGNETIFTNEVESEDLQEDYDEYLTPRVNDDAYSYSSDNQSIFGLSENSLTSVNDHNISSSSISSSSCVTNDGPLSPSYHPDHNLLENNIKNNNVEMLDQKYLICTPIRLNKSPKLSCQRDSPINNAQKLVGQGINVLENVELNSSIDSDVNFFDKSNDSFMDTLYQDL